MLGGLLALLSAATFALNNASLRRGVLTGSVAQAMAVTVPIGLPIFLLAAILTGNLTAVANFSPHALMLLSLAGIVHFVWGRYCNYRATRAMGANLVAPVQQTAMIVTLSMALTVLGEVLTPLRLLGIALVILGPAVSQGGKPITPDEKPKLGAAADLSKEVVPLDPAKRPQFRPNYSEGYFFALLSTTGYGTSPILLRLALEHKSMGDSIAAGVVAYGAATAVMALILLWPGQFRHVLAVNRKSIKWFTISGVFVCVSQIFLYMAVTMAPITVVTPINRLSLLFRLYFGRLLNPEHEVFGGRIVLGTFVSIFGALMLSLSTDVVLQLFDLPDSVRDLLNWHWPS